MVTKEKLTDKPRICWLCKKKNARHIINITESRKRYLCDEHYEKYLKNKEK